LESEDEVSFEGVLYSFESGLKFFMGLRLNIARNLKWGPIRKLIGRGWKIYSIRIKENLKIRENGLKSFPAENDQSKFSTAKTDLAKSKFPRF